MKHTNKGGEKMAKAGELTEKQKKFAQEYLKDFNGARAAREAGYSEKTADKIAYENLRKVEIKEYLTKLQKDIKDKYEISEAKIMKELSAIAFSRITDYVQIEDGMETSITPTEMLEDYQIAAISEINQSDKGAIKIKFENKIEALKLLGKQIGMFNEKIEVTRTNISDEERELLNKVNKRLDDNA